MTFLPFLRIIMAYEGFYRGAPPVGRLFRNNDIIPILGFGTGTGYFERPEAVAEGMLLAFNAGYRLIDTAQVNDNLVYITNKKITHKRKSQFYRDESALVFCIS